MMFFKYVKLMFWDDAALCVAYINNRHQSNSIKSKTPYEMWYGHIPLVRDLKVVGSIYYALIPKE